jgi:tRNA (guanine37-N1)-methyltransferase
MRFTILTLFPEILEGFFGSSIMAKAVERGLLSYRLVNIRDYALDKHHKCDDEVYGGGPGMLMLPGPLGRALDAVGAREGGRRVVYPSPSGRPFSQALAKEYSREEELILICGRYEGIDQRIIDLYVHDEVSIGDYVLSSGEVAALVLVDSVYRLVPGVISGESLEEESFSDGLLEYPQYTRPEVYANLRVPEVLLSGHHANIERWRLRKRVEKTLRCRPELLEREDLPEALGSLARELRERGYGNGYSEDTHGRAEEG